jgi:hypothetical protein
MMLNACDATKTNSQRSISHISVFLFASIAKKEARNLIKFLLLSESRVDQFITACSQLPLSLPFGENSISSVSIIVVNTFSPTFLFPSVAQRKAKSAFL